MPSPGELVLQVEVEADRHTLFAAGEVDIATTPELVTTLVELLAQGARSIVLDMGDVTFIDSTGLRGIFLVRELCEARGCDLEFTRVQRQAQRVFEFSGVLDRLPLVADAPVLDAEAVITATRIGRGA